MENGHEPATKADLAALRVDLTADLAAVEARLNERIEILRGEVQHSFDDLKETMRDTQTELLKSFYTFAESNNKRLTAVEGNDAVIQSRLATIEDRLLEVEKRLNMPPAA
jgi:adenosine/AMP kinase